MLCTPPAFILSQDQTLKQIVYHPLPRFDSFELFILAFFTFLELCSLWFWQILFSHLLNFALYFFYLLFNCQVSIAPRFYVSLSIISLIHLFVKRFFKTFLSFLSDFFAVFLRQLHYFTTLVPTCQALISNFSRFLRVLVNFSKSPFIEACFCATYTIKVA